MAKLIYEPEPFCRGAEAELSYGTWNGRECVVKRRIRKGYRDVRLDDKIRLQRIKNEVRLMSAARECGVNVPIIYDVDIENKQFVMERIKGDTLKKVLSEIEPQKAKMYIEQLVSLVFSLHSGSIAHGDLTTSNVLAGEDGRLYLIDLSFGEKTSETELLGVDIHLITEAFKSAHIEHLETFTKMMEKYRTAHSKGAQVIKTARDIESRGRYT